MLFQPPLLLNRFSGFQKAPRSRAFLVPTHAVHEGENLSSIDHSLRAETRSPPNCLKLQRSHVLSSALRLTDPK